jgi:branched-chain amino acid transport system ATP-binding protein
MTWQRTAATAIVIAAVSFLIVRGNNYQVFIIVTVGLTAIVGIGLNVLLGLNGQISLGHVAFYAIGAYAVGILTTAYDWSFWPALAVSGLVAGLAGVLLAIPALKVRGPYLAMVTIAFGFVVEQGAAEWQGLTGGWNGLSGIPGPSVFGSDIGERGIAFLTVALTVLATAAFARLSGSVWGNAMRAVRDSESASISIGLDPTLIRTTAFGISAVAAGVAGGVYASISNFIRNPFRSFSRFCSCSSSCSVAPIAYSAHSSALWSSSCCRSCWQRSANTGCSLSAS